jgi:hypothetical protein
MSKARSPKIRSSTAINRYVRLVVETDRLWQPPSADRARARVLLRKVQKA